MAVTALFHFRWKLVQLGLDEQYKRLHDFKRGVNPSASAGGGRDGAESTASGSNSSQDFLSVAVHYPWARAISQNKVPYYIK